MIFLVALTLFIVLVFVTRKKNNGLPLADIYDFGFVDPCGTSVTGVKVAKVVLFNKANEEYEFTSSNLSCSNAMQKSNTNQPQGIWINSYVSGSSVSQYLQPFSSYVNSTTAVFNIKTAYPELQSYTLA